MFDFLLCTTVEYKEDLSRVAFTKLHLSLGESAVALERQNEQSLGHRIYRHVL